MWVGKFVDKSNDIVVYVSMRHEKNIFSIIVEIKGGREVRVKMIFYIRSMLVLNIVSTQV